LSGKLAVRVLESGRESAVARVTQRNATMKRMLIASVFALLVAGSASAQGIIPPPGMVGDFGPGTIYTSPGLGFINKRPAPFGHPPYGTWGLGFRMFAGIHQHGPLVNYGPYEGYYPFEPYGPWTSNLEYTGPMIAPGAWGWNADYGLLRGGRARGVVRGTGSYALSTLRNIAQRINPFARFRGTVGCTTCSTGSTISLAGSSEAISSSSLPVVHER
jgi:hypothetical protein